MINSSTSTVRKYQFFEEVKDQPSKNENEKQKSQIITSHQNSPEEDTPITLNDVTPNSIDQMNVIDDIIFINGKAIHKIQGSLARESIILKIYNKEVVDSYRMFNGVYYFFQIKYFSERPIFVTAGGNFDKYISKGREELFMFTSIKIYDALPLLQKNDKRYPTPKGIKPTDEQYPKLLLKQIKLLKNIKTEELVCDTEGDKMEGYESFQNILTVAINSSFTHIAVGLDKGDILLISAYPNIFDCSEKEMKMRFLPKIIPKDREIHITNLEFSEMFLNNEPKRILYASTASAVYYYEWRYETERGSNSENFIELKELVQDGKGAYRSGISVKENMMLLASSNNDFIIEYENLDFGKTWFFEGNKNCIKYFKDNYFIFVVHTEKMSEIHIYDKINKFFICYISDNKKIIGICCDNEYIYVLYEDNNSKKNILKLKEKENKDKFEIFYSKNQYEIALSYAENSGFDKEKISEITKKYAEYEYSKGDFDNAVMQYIKTINYLEPSLVIQKFLEKSKLDYLIQYLEALENNKDFQIKGHENAKDYTTLLLNCYIMQEKIPKLKEFMNKKGHNFPAEIIKTAIDVCLETQNIDLALSIAKQKNMNEEYLQILILKLNKLEEALDFIAPPEDKKGKDELLLKDKINLFYKFGDYFLKNSENNNEKIPDLFFSRIIAFIEKNMHSLNKNDVVKLIQIFIINDKYFKTLFEKMESYGIEFSQEMIHRRIELYLDEEENKHKIKEMLKDEKFKGKYDIQYLFILFKYKEFKEGIEILSQIIKKNQELLNIYMTRKEYEKIIDICSNDNNDTGISSCGLILNYFLDKNLRASMNEEEITKINEYLKKLLQKILNENLMLPISVLQIINERNNDLPIDIINSFMEKALEKEVVDLDNLSKNTEIYSNQINETNKKITELNTNALTFNLNLCDECDMALSFPCVCYKCGHNFHSLCINANIGDDISNIDCPKCKKNKSKVEKELKDADNYYKFINDNINFKNELEKSENKMAFLSSLYGKGLFNIVTSK